ncbi:MAG: IS66 family transposase [Reyranella sp.]|nr:IS66 family transposase [Reyranella sp.]
MEGTADSLPNDVEALRAIALKALAERDRARAERDQAIEQSERLRRLLRQANDALYGSKSERLSKLDPEQLALALEDIEQALAKSEAVQAKAPGVSAQGRDGRRTSNRGALPAHLPRLHRTILPDDTDCPCCRAPMQAIGEETAERLDVIPAQYRVIVTHRPKLACRACEKISQAPAPEHLIRSGLPTEALVASVVVSKYGWHLPLYRQARMLTTQGIDVDRSTLAFWVGYAAAELTPLYQRLKQTLLGSAKLAVDETPVPVLDPGRGKTKTGYFWTMARDDRPWAGADPPAVVYTYAPGRGGEHLQVLLGSYRGIVQCDGYAPYKKLPADRIALAFCWAHLRRKFFDIAKGGNAPIATEALARIAALYEIEAAIRGQSAEQRQAARQAQSAPLADAFKAFLEQQLARLSGKSDTAEAIRYGLNHWNGLVRFLGDGRIELDTNIVERSMRPQALTRKNALFAGHDDGADNWAIVASLIETAKLNGVDPQAWLADVLGRLVNLWPNDRLDELMPWRWANPRQQGMIAA